MLGFFIGLLTVLLVLDCLFLVLLVLVQLPKKEAGMGQAFGGAATDALFGAGSGNALTKMTKWTAGIFFVLAIVLTLLGNYAASRTGGAKLQELMQTAPAPVPPPSAAPSATPPPTTTPAKPALDLKITNAPKIHLTNAPASPAAGTPPPASPAPAK